MTFDVSLVDKNGEVIPTPMAIHGLSYGAKTLALTSKYILTDGYITAAKARKQALKFHAEMVMYCQDKSGSNDYFGSDGEGYYFKHTPEQAEAYDTTTRWLQIYMVAMALKCGIRFK